MTKIAVAALVVGLLGLPVIAAADPPRPDEHGYSAGDGDWFKSLKQPGSGMGCCSVADCRYVEYTIDQNGHYLIEPRVMYDDRFKGFPGAEKIWTTVPDNVVLHNKMNPTGHAVACYGLNWMDNLPSIGPIFCFIPGFGV